MEIYIESMGKFFHRVAPWLTYTIRLWRQELNYEDKNSEESIKAAADAIKDLKTEDKKEIAETILKVDRMNAVEVLDETGNGICTYKDWP